MPEPESYRKLLYQYELLRARLLIREYYLKTIVNDVYENIGQMLSLVRVQLSLIYPGHGRSGMEKIATSGELVGGVIKDLRSMCRRFHPDEEILSGSGFHLAMEQVLKDINPDIVYGTKNISALPENNPNGRMVILFGILLEIFNLVKEQENGQLISVEAEYGKKQMDFSIEYSGEMIKRNKGKQTRDLPDMSVFERTGLLKGNLQIKKIQTGSRRIKLVIPTKQT